MYRVFRKMQDSSMGRCSKFSLTVGNGYSLVDQENETSTEVKNWLGAMQKYEGTKVTEEMLQQLFRKLNCQI